MEYAVVIFIVGLTILLFWTRKKKLPYHVNKGQIDTMEYYKFVIFQAIYEANRIHEGLSQENFKKVFDKNSKYTYSDPEGMIETFKSLYTMIDNRGDLWLNNRGEANYHRLNIIYGKESEDKE